MLRYVNATLRSALPRVISGVLLFTSVSADVSPATLYQTHCAACHGAERTGGMGPALLPENLERLRKPLAQHVIAQGRQATQMPGFSAVLSELEQKAVLDFIYEKPAIEPTFAEAQIRGSRVVYVEKPLPNTPVFDADLMNVFIVVEGGDHHVSIVDGDTFERIHRFQSRYALHGGPKFTPDGRYVYFGSRDGWITKFDLWNLTVVAEVRAALNMRNVAVSNDGRVVIAGNYLPQNVVLFDADLNLLQVMPATAADGSLSRVSAVYDAGPRESFIVALKDVAEIWEIPYKQANKASVRFSAVVTPLDSILDDFFFDQSYTHVFGAARNGNAQVINLDKRQKVADLPLGGMPHLGSGVSFDWGEKRVFASPDLKTGKINVIDMEKWRLVQSIDIPGPGFFVRSHEQTPYMWTDSMMSAHKDTLTVIDKRSLTVVKQIRTDPGKTLAHIEFTKDGRFALASLWEDDGALIVFDANTFAEVKRLPMRKPVGKYNVFNKITRSEGTSH